MTDDRQACENTNLARIGVEPFGPSRVYGRLVFPGRGDRGFGYDPIFIPDGHDITFAEMDPNDKHRMSHRADAFAQLVARCFQAPLARET